MKKVEDIIAALDAVRSVQEEDELDRLGEAMDAAPACDRPAEAVDALLRVFERFPTDDGFGSFWRILHMLEGLPGYETHLVASVRHRPSLFSLTMVNGLLNAGVEVISGQDLITLLRTVAERRSLPIEVRQQAEDFLAHQWGRKPK